MIIKNIVFDRRLIESNYFDNILKKFNANVELKYDSNLDENLAEFRQNIDKIFSLAKGNYKIYTHNLYTINEKVLFLLVITRVSYLIFRSLFIK